MTESINVNGTIIKTLTEKSILELHNLLSTNIVLFKGMEPITPKGVKNYNLLSSAVHRQYTGFDNYYKYDTIFLNAASLAFGLAKNHSFHNGNKRTALLAIIKHLFLNGYVLKPRLKENELYELILYIVENKLNLHCKKYLNNCKFIIDNIYNEKNQINYIAEWLKRNSIHRKYYIPSEIKIKHFRKIIEKKGIEYKEYGNYIILTKYKYKKKFFILKKEIEKQKKYSIGKKKNVIKNAKINKIRKDFNLTLYDGVDHNSFYDTDNFINDEIKKYKSIIYKLSKT